MIIQVLFVSDNHNPFKGPFKGKGQNRSALKELEVELAGIRTEMRNIVEQFDDSFQAPRPVNLRILGKRLYPLLWWRVPGSSGTYIRLFDSDKGSAILETIMPYTRQTMVSFDRERIRLNFRSVVVGNTVESYRRRERDLAILDAYLSDCVT